MARKNSLPYIVFYAICTRARFNGHEKFQRVLYTDEFDYSFRNRIMHRDSLIEYFRLIEFHMKNSDGKKLISLLK